MKMIINEINAPFFAAIGSKKSKTPGVLVKFFGRAGLHPFPAEMIEELKSDHDVESVSDGETGEIIYICE